jgi:hypothetical protein
MVAALLEDPTDQARAQRITGAYVALLERRFAKDRARFDALAQLARDHAVHIGCSCPTARQPDVSRCHTVLALRFMKKRYPKLDVRMP